MFFLNGLIKSYPLPEADRKCLLWYLERYAKTPEGEWLNWLDFRNVRYRYCYAFDAKGGIMGAFTMLNRKAIYLMPYYQAAETPEEYAAQPVRSSEIRITRGKHVGIQSTWIPCIADVCVHELRHKWQCEKRYGFWRYLLLCIPGIRALTVEKDASEVQAQARDRFLEWSSELDREDFRKRNANEKEEKDR